MGAGWFVEAAEGAAGVMGTLGVSSFTSVYIICTSVTGVSWRFARRLLSIGLVFEVSLVIRVSNKSRAGFAVVTSPNRVPTANLNVEPILSSIVDFLIKLFRMISRQR